MHWARVNTADSCTGFVAATHFCPIAMTRLSAPMTQNMVIAKMVDIDRHHKTNGAMLILKEEREREGNGADEEDALQAHLDTTSFTSPR